MKNILIVDDDEYLRKQIYWTLKESYKLLQAGNRAQACRIMNKNSVDLVLLDLHLPPEEDTPEEGMRALEAIKAIDPETKVVVITGDQEEETSLRAINNGAYDYFSKPFDLKEIKIILKRALYLQSLERENRRLREELSRKAQFANIIGEGDRMKLVFQMIKIVAQSDCAVLIRGESGTGKELVARTIHHSGPRRDKPFVAVNCAAIPEALLESELFGYEKGAFTDAARSKPGKFERASGGTIFLDEIADMSLAMQAKILRVLQEHTFERLGGTHCLTADVRLISATNKNLEKLIQRKCFREDLYYRLNVVCLQLPSLREKKEDIPLLVDHFLGRFSQLNRKRIKRVSSRALNLLIDYEWPGNVRELENVIERAVVLTTGDTIFPWHLPSHLHEKKESVFTFSFTDVSLEQREKELIEKVLQTTGWNQSKAAKKLGIHRNTLRLKIKKFGMPRP